MKTVLVTGAGGFIGNEVLKLLSARNHLRVVAFDSLFEHRSHGASIQYIDGDLCDRDRRLLALSDGIDAVIHLAAVPGGAAEANPALSQRVNIEATLNLLQEASAAGRPRFVFASTIAVFGDPLPTHGVDDSTPLMPRLIYGAHKAMVETMVATLTRRGAIDGVSLRLPGIVARPRGPSGLKSAFMSELFHSLREASVFVSPVSARATLWLMSVKQCAANLVHALDFDTDKLPAARVVTLPALHVSMADLVATVATHTKAPLHTVTYAADVELEKGFGRQPPLATPAAEAAGFTHDGSLDILVTRALNALT